jgi:hypothetical protein
MIVDGQRDVVGSDRSAVDATRTRAEAAEQTAAAVNLVRTADRVEVTIGTGTGHGDVLLVGYDRQH